MINPLKWLTKSGSKKPLSRRDFLKGTTTAAGLVLLPEALADVSKPEALPNLKPVAEFDLLQFPTESSPPEPFVCDLNGGSALLSQQSASLLVQIENAWVEEEPIILTEYCIDQSPIEDKFFNRGEPYTKTVGLDFSVELSFIRDSNNAAQNLILSHENVGSPLSLRLISKNFNYQFNAVVIYKSVRTDFEGMDPENPYAITYRDVILSIDGPLTHLGVVNT